MSRGKFGVGFIEKVCFCLSVGFFFVFFGSDQSFSAELKHRTKQEKIKGEVAKSPITKMQEKAREKNKDEPSHEKNAVDKASEPRFGVAANVGYVYFNVGFGAEAWYNFSHKLQAGGQFLMTPNTELQAGGGDALYAEYLKFGQMSFIGKGRYFVWHSFFVGGGLSYTNVSGIYGVKESSTGTLYKSTISGSAIMGNVSLGNQWKISNLVVGADWILGSFPLSMSVTPGSDTLTDDNGKAPAIDVISKKGDTVSSSATNAVRTQMAFMALVVGVGVVF